MKVLDNTWALLCFTLLYSLLTEVTLNQVTLLYSSLLFFTLLYSALLLQESRDLLTLRIR